MATRASDGRSHRSSKLRIRSKSHSVKAAKDAIRTTKVRPSLLKPTAQKSLVAVAHLEQTRKVKVQRKRKVKE